MEFDLDQSFDRARQGTTFPQYLNTWEECFSSVEKEIAAIVEEAKDRSFTVALEARDPQIFCSVLVSLGRMDLGVALFNPAWTEREREQALQAVKPLWHLKEDDEGALIAERNLREDAQNDSLEPGTRFLIPTGGTSGSVRFAVHRWETLLSATRGLAEHFHATSISSCCMLPLYHVSGFMQIIRSIFTQGYIVFGTTDEFSRLSCALGKWAEGERYLSLVSTQLERLTKHAESLKAMRSYRAIFVGGGPIAESTLVLAKELRLPLAPTYGMTETAAQVATQLPERFLQGDRGVGAPLPHVNLSIVGETGETLGPGKVGRIEIKGLSLFNGYEGESARSPNRFSTPDRGSLDEEGNLFVLGRADRVIVSGGEKIDLEEVELALDESGLVKERVAFGIEDKQWGERLAVAYAPMSKEVTDSALLAALEEKLTRYKLPKTWLRLDTLPRNEAGKLRLGPLLERAKGRI